jgi:Baseplate J-like protein
MSCTGTSNCNCGCCSGTSVQTPQPRNNLPGLPSVSYRVGTWANFKESMLARLSSSDYPALALLKTRSDDDFTIALMDAAAIVLDVLSFYQERLANENYLRTAGQLQSLTELSRLIGYQPSPGVSASTYVAFSLRAAPGQTPDPSAPAFTIPQGTQMQSVPRQGQTPQIFETSAAIQAKPDWCALPVQSRVRWIPPGSGNSVYLCGTSTQLNLGDSLLLLGVRREGWSSAANPTPSDQWQVVVLNEVRVDTVRNLTYVSWDNPLTPESESMEIVEEDMISPRLERSEVAPKAISVLTNEAIRSIDIGRLTPIWGIGRLSIRLPVFIPPPSPWVAAKVFAFRQKATLFGHNAPHPNLFVNLNLGTPTSSITSLPFLIDVPLSGNIWSWNSFWIVSAAQIDLDATYPKIVIGSWFALVSSGVAQLFKVQNAQTVSISNFGLSGKVTELEADYQDPNIRNAFPLPGTEVWAQSDELQVAEQPLTYPLYGTLLDLQDLRPDILSLQVVALYGKRQKIAVEDGVIGLSFVPDDGTGQVPLVPGDVFTLTDPTPLPLATNGTIPDWTLSTSTMMLSVEDVNGRTGTIQAALNQFTLLIAGSSDPNVSEYALVSTVITTDAPYPHTQIQLQSTLANCYDRTLTTVNVNVALATNGQSVTEIMGSGNASTPDQSFTLKQSPLTYVQAPTPSGRQSTLQVQANGAAWTEVPSLYDAGPSDQVFATLNQPGGTSEVVFGGDGEGSLLPTGQNNIQANYRIGLGSPGNVAANTLTTLIDRPLGVSGVTNPAAATGGQDPQSVDDIRSNAPLTVLTLGRAVSLTDYQNYTNTFAGIAKAYAVWNPSGQGQGVFLTVAGVNGAALPPGNPTLRNLVASLQNYGNPLIAITIQSFVETLFGLSADLKYDPAYDQPTVQAQVLQALSQAYGFAQRSFGQGISVDEITTFIQNVPGVVAVNVTAVYIVASSTGGDLAGMSNGYTLSNWNSWMAQQVTVPRPNANFGNLIYGYLPTANSQSLPLPAEIMVLDPNPTSVILGVMS